MKCRIACFLIAYGFAILVAESTPALDPGGEEAPKVWKIWSHTKDANKNLVVDLTTEDSILSWKWTCHEVYQGSRYLRKTVTGTSTATNYRHVTAKQTRPTNFTCGCQNAPCEGDLYEVLATDVHKDGPDSFAW